MTSSMVDGTNEAPTLSKRVFQQALCIVIIHIPHVKSSPVSGGEPQWRSHHAHVSSSVNNDFSSPVFVIHCSHMHLSNHSFAGMQGRPIFNFFIPTPRSGWTMTGLPKLRYGLLFFPNTIGAVYMTSPGTSGFSRTHRPKSVLGFDHCTTLSFLRHSRACAHIRAYYQCNLELNCDFTFYNIK